MKRQQQDRSQKLLTDWDRPGVGDNKMRQASVLFDIVLLHRCRNTQDFPVITQAVLRSGLKCLPVQFLVRQ